jgi:hypothetical protein
MDRPGWGLARQRGPLGSGPLPVLRTAYSGRPEDRDFVELERRIVRAALAAASAAEPSPTDWQAAAEALEHEHVHWRLPELDDVFELE